MPAVGKWEAIPIPIAAEEVVAVVVAGAAEAAEAEAPAAARPATSISRHPHMEAIPHFLPSPK